MPALHGGGVRYIADDNEALDQPPGPRRFRSADPGDAMALPVLNLRMEPESARRARRARQPALLVDPGPSGVALLARDKDGIPNFEEINLYQKILPTAKPAGPALHALRRLADGLTKPPKPGEPASCKPSLPAAYTYFGQFLAHDMSHMVWNPAINGWENGQHLHALNFDTLFGLDAAETELNSAAQSAHDTWIGRDSRGRAADLPRSGAEGTPRCPDPRSDSNLGLAQMTVLLTRFHQRAAKHLHCDTDQAKAITRRHLQAVVLTDFLKWMVPRHVYDSVMRDGRQIVATTRNVGFEIPIEFAAACFRMGHSMVRQKYKPWFPHDFSPKSFNDIAHVDDLLLFTSGGKGLSNGVLPDSWVQPWHHATGQPWEFGDETLTAAGMDTEVASGLKNLPKRLFEPRANEALPEKLSLTRRTLELGGRLGLPSGQRLYSLIKKQNIAMLDLKLDVRGFLQDRSQRFGALHANDALCEETPLWFYTLAEAERQRGPGLGEVAGRVVMETFHAAIELAEASILTASGGGTSINFRRRLRQECGPGTCFSLSDLVAVAGLPH